MKKGKKMKKHGCLWWLCVSWWWLPIKWTCYSVPAFLTRKIKEIMQTPAVTQATTTPKATTGEPYVYITTKGKKYHYDILCPALRNAKEIKMDLSKARKAGYTACDKCCYNYLHEKDWEG
jgi:hypothetical protein